jgi:hypothetical protein
MTVKLSSWSVSMRVLDEIIEKYTKIGKNKKIRKLH